VGTGSAVVLLGHGSRRAEANRGLEQVARAVGSLLDGEAVEIAYLQLARPGLAEAVERCVAAGARRVAVVPFFIPAEVERLRALHPGVVISVGRVLGDHPKLAQAAADRAREALG